MATDDELARQLAQFPDDDRISRPSWRRSHRDYSPEVEMLSAVFDRIGELIRVTAHVRGGRGKPPPPAPRPVAAIERVRRQLKQERHRALAARVLRRPPPAT